MASEKEKREFREKFEKNVRYVSGVQDHVERAKRAAEDNMSSPRRVRIKIEPGTDTRGCSGCVTRGDDRHRPGCSQDENWGRKQRVKQEFPNEVTFDHNDGQPRRENSETNQPMVKQEKEDDWW